MGLISINGKLHYKWNGGFGYRWLPDTMQQWIVWSWNPIGCILFGHGIALPVGFEEDPHTNYSAWPGPWHCIDCCRDFP